LPFLWWRGVAQHQLELLLIVDIGEASIALWLSRCDPVVRLASLDFGESLLVGRR
jgi:hypothetical protein